MGLIDREWEKILSEGEFSTRNNDVSVVLIHDDVEYPVSCLNARAWKRKEVEGRLLQDIPSETRTIMISADSMPPSIPQEDYQKLTVVVNGEYFAVMFKTGTDLLRFFLKGAGELGVERESNVLVDDPVSFDDEIEI